MSARELGRVVLLGLAVAVGVLLLSDLSGELRGGAGSWRWGLVAQLGIGATAAAGALAGRRSAGIPAVAGVLLLWPLLASVSLVSHPPGFIPLLSAGSLDVVSLGVAAGVLAAGAVDALRR